MQRQQELHQTKKFHLPVFLKYSIECRQSSFTCGIHDQRGLRFSLLNGVFMWICHQVTFQEIVSEPQTPFCPASYLYFTAKFILRNETSTAFISETGRFPIVKFGQIRCFNLKLERIKKSKQSEKVTLASRNTLTMETMGIILAELTKWKTASSQLLNQFIPIWLKQSKYLQVPNPILIICIISLLF